MEVAGRPFDYGPDPPLENAVRHRNGIDDANDVSYYNSIEKYFRNFQNLRR